MRYRTSNLSVDVGPVVLDGEHAVVRVRTELVDGPDIQAVDLYPPRTQNETFGPGDPILAHKQEECVPVEHLVRCERQLAEWLTD